jgi:catechol 2,3-dioxygenase-like lactoylglutathione lyase family enzyme
VSFHGVVAQLRTTDMAGSLRFWTETVGLSVAFTYEDFYAGVQAGTQLFHLKLSDTPDPSIPFVAAGDHFHLYLGVDDAAAMAAWLAAKRVPFVKPLTDTPWGTREFVIRDDQGHTIYIGEVTAR